MALAVQVQERRKQAGLTQAELAERAGVQRTTISEIERGQTSSTVRIIGKLACGLACTVADLLADAPPASEQPRAAE